MLIGLWLGNCMWYAKMIYKIMELLHITKHFNKLVSNAMTGRHISY